MVFHEFDMHVHTPFSDGQVDIDTLIGHLIDAGIKLVGFADHIFPFAIYLHPKGTEVKPEGLTNSFSAEFLKYRKKVIRFYDKKYPQIKILNGGEIDIYPHGGLSLPKGISPDFFDYLLVSKHHTVPKHLGFLYKRYPKLNDWVWKNSPRMKLNAELWERGIYQAFSKYPVDIFAHFQEGMPESIGRMQDSRRLKRFVYYCKKNNVAIELNNLLWDKRRKMNHTKWSYPIFEYGHEMGAKFSLASDFHGFSKNYGEQVRKSQDMMEIVDKYDLDLIDPREYIKRIK